MTSVEVLAARAVIVGLLDDVMPEGYSRGLGIQLDDVATMLATRERAVADALAAAEKASEEAAALAAYGGVAAAEAGWNALRQHNPKIDRSTGMYGESGEIRTFSDLPFKKKLEYAAIAFGVLYPGAKLGVDSMGVPYQFKDGERVRITGPRVRTNGSSSQFTERISETGVVTVGLGVLENMGVGVCGDNQVFAWLDPASLTLATKPRTWERPEPIPEGVVVKDARGRKSTRKHGFMERMDGSDVGGMDGPFTEVIA
ncbi:hypothetical protein [Rhodococcus erythropolis]|uniref:hypothetical protein n=1 Tax=Rhodococcus erythropolis TaxID=1833 RepID=UPI003670EEA4